MQGRTRIEASLLLAAVAGAVGFYLGERYADPPGCDDVGHCSLGTELGLLWAGFAAVLVLAFVGMVELALLVRRRSV